MGNSGSTAPAPLGKTHVPDLEWKVHDFSALLETKATSVLSAPFHCSGYNWCLQVTPKHKQDAQVTPKHKQDDKGNPYVALSLMMSQGCLEPGHTVHADFELSIFNHSKGMYYGYKASHNYAFQNGYSNKECLISLQELLKSSAFLVDDSCVFGVEILKIDVSSPEKKAVVVQKKATTVQNLFIQKKGFIKGTYTWTINNFQELDSQNFVRSPKFEVGGHKWYIGMYPRGERRRTDCLALGLYRESADELSRKVVQITLSILDQKNGKYLTRTTNLLVCTHPEGWGWIAFLPLKELQDKSRGYLIESKYVLKADFTIFGSSNDG
ncbi:uncharacterized protein [Triticum aestivum]|uniref:MATH domain-containing protein n=1 Tax=Triticum turgidum subsp. durum TaxID=4567 RepID=A0A9R0V3G0_TRITD|nr:uncharacterized protein LOC123180712 [Triticum aestivum]VAH10976.1 unnamed protein product [Triticum turgidum subsp. durum]